MSEYSSPTPEEILAFSEKYARRMYKSDRWQKFDREDFTQELAIKLLRAADRYNKRIPWRPYAYIIARGAYLDWYRRINNHEELMWDHGSGDWNDDSMSSAWDNLLVTYDFIDLTPHEIIKWSKQFNEQRRKVIICLTLGYTNSEIARILGVSEGRITKIIHAIRRQIVSQNEN